LVYLICCINKQIIISSKIILNKRTNDLKKKTVLWLVLDGLLLALLSLYIFAGIKTVPFHGDESTLIALSLDWERIEYEDQVNDVVYHTYEPGTWQGIEQFTRVLTGSLNPLTIGMARDIVNFPAEQVNGYWQWGESEQDPYAPYMWFVNEEYGNLPSESLLTLARIPSTMFTVGSVLLLFLLVFQLTGKRFAAWGSVLVYATTPAVLVNGRRAMQEGALLFFTMLVILMLLAVIKELEIQPIRWTTLRFKLTGLGLVSGFAVASKHTAVLIVIAAYVVLAALLLLTSRIKINLSNQTFRYLMIVFASGFLSIFIFFLLMPVWWDIPRLLFLGGLPLVFLSFSLNWRKFISWLPALAGLVIAGLAVILSPNLGQTLFGPPAIILSEREQLAAGQASFLGGMETPEEKTSLLWQELFFADSEYFEAPRWAEYAVVGEQINIYETRLLDGRGGIAIWDWLLLALFILGLGSLFRFENNERVALILVWLIFPLSVIWATNFLPWQRYYLILQPQVAVLAGLGVGQLSKWAKDYFHKVPVSG